MTEITRLQTAPSVMIMTLNEERNIQEAIESFPPGIDLTVYDSHSSDSTVQIARGLGAAIVQRQFDDWSTHQNWAVANIRFKSPWVYYSDADERMTASLWGEICRSVARPMGKVAFEMRRKDYFAGKWIRHSSFYPCWFLRLFQPQFVRWERLVNPVATVAGPTGRLNEHFLHFPFSKGVGFWFERHLKYADFEARELIQNAISMGDLRLLLRGSQRDRRRTLKRVFQSLPGRPGIKFATLYFLRRGFLDGKPGLRYALMQSMYEYVISLRLAELKDPRMTKTWSASPDSKIAGTTAQFETHGGTFLSPRV